jgi:hypothetical protein
MTFSSDGYIRTTVPMDKLEAAEEVITALYVMQARKCGFDVDTVQDALKAMEPEHKREAFEVLGLIASSPVCQGPFHALLPQAEELLDGNPAYTQTPGILLFINYTQRTMYGWHTEAHYYPKRRDLINVWMPIFTDRLGTDTMSIIPGGHKKHYSFQEFNMGANSLSHFEIPDDELDMDREYYLESRRGEAFLMHRNMPHRSNPSHDISFALVGRIWNPEGDLTFSSKPSAKPYTDDMGAHRVQT